MSLGPGLRSKHMGSRMVQPRALLRSCGARSRGSAEKLFAAAFLLFFTFYELSQKKLTKSLILYYSYIGKALVLTELFFWGKEGNFAWNDSCKDEWPGSRAYGAQGNFFCEQTYGKQGKLSSLRSLALSKEGTQLAVGVWIVCRTAVSGTELSRNCKL